MRNQQMQFMAIFRKIKDRHRRAIAGPLAVRRAAEAAAERLGDCPAAWRLLDKAAEAFDRQVAPMDKKAAAALREPLARYRRALAIAPLNCSLCKAE